MKELQQIIFIKTKQLKINGSYFGQAFSKAIPNFIDSDAIFCKFIE